MEPLPWFVNMLIGLITLGIGWACIWYVHSFGLVGLLFAFAVVYAIKFAWLLADWLWF